MKLIAVPTRDEMVDNHFGHCEYYTVFHVDDNNNIINSQRLDSPQGCGCKSNIASVMQQMGITIMLAGNMGEGAYNKLTQHNIGVIRGCSGPVVEVIKAYLNGSLIDFAMGCDHHDCGHHDDEKKPLSGFKLAL